MSTIKERIIGQFVAELDLHILMRFVEDRITKYGEVNIGLEFDRRNEALKSKPFQTEGYLSKKKWPTFAKNNDQFYWTSDCQIPHQLVPYVKERLKEQGLKTNCRGCCGYDTYDVLVVTM